MRRCIGIVREVKNKWERRVPVVPRDVHKLVRSGVNVLIQPSNKRIFTDEEYRKAGATVTADLSPASAILGVKQIPVESLMPRKNYVIFSHVIKAQPENMPLLDACLEKKIRLFDYEVIRAPKSDGGKRLVAFGHFAGVTGFIDGMRGFGEQLLSRGYSTPFLSMGSSYMYPSIEAAKRAMAEIGEAIKTSGLPESLPPMVFTFTGNGNVTKGALEMFSILPHKMVDPRDLPGLMAEAAANPSRHRQVYGTILDASHLVEPSDSGKSFVKSDYYQNPQDFRPVFHERIAPHTSFLINGMYWDARFPRLVTLDQMDALHEKHPNALMCAADITCDLQGSLEFLRHYTEIDNPFLVYHPGSRRVSSQIDGGGTVVLGVDNLPAEFPREASEHFSSALYPFLEDLAASDISQPLSLPEPFQNACVTSDGALTSPFRYIPSLRAEGRAQQAEAEDGDELARSFILEGHLFDHNVINSTLDLVESRKGRAKIVHFDTGNTVRNTSRAVLQVSCPSPEALQGLMHDVAALIKKEPRAEASFKELSYPATQHNLQSDLKGDAFAGASLGSSSGSSGGRDEPKRGKYEQAKTAPKRVLVLGSGFVAAPVLEYLSTSGTNTLVVASNVASQAEALAKDNPHVSAVHLDASDHVSMERHVKDADLVISLLPASCHVDVAKLCLAHRKDLVTASYVSPEMRALHDKAVGQGVTLLNEVGLDPGIDHMSAMRVIDEVKDHGGAVTSFVSACGGLPAPEVAYANNPLHYKFSWNPRGVLSASQNSARYLRDGVVHEVDGEKLLDNAEPIKIPNSGFALEMLPNRDSIPYSDAYGLSDLTTMFRGTLRFEGFSYIMSAMRQAGLFSGEKIPEKVRNWPELMVHLRRDFTPPYPMQNSSSWGAFKASTQSGDPARILQNNLSVMTAEAFLGLSNIDEPLPRNENSTVIDSFCKLLESKLAYDEGERDMVLLHHNFGVRRPDFETETRLSTLLCYGDPLGAPGGHSAMAKTVGYPTAICAQMVLNDEFDDTGVHIPLSPKIYKPCLDKLQDVGIEFKEETVASE